MDKEGVIKSEVRFFFFSEMMGVVYWRKVYGELLWDPVEEGEEGGELSSSSR